jgi:hypothetical protein
MKQISKHPIFTVSMVSIILLLSSNNLFSYIECNGSGSGYVCPLCKGLGFQNEIESIIIEGADYYLQGNSYIQTLLNRVELQDLKEIDYLEMQGLVNKALENITNSRLAYEKLLNKVKNMPYNLVVIEKLKSFDYKTFMIENRLNEVVFKKVEDYLSIGDITGSYKHVLSSIKKIERLLISMKNGMDFSRLEPFWKINELCSEFSLFGSFVSRVFYQIHQM